MSTYSTLRPNEQEWLGSDRKAPKVQFAQGLQRSFNTIATCY